MRKYIDNLTFLFLLVSMFFFCGEVYANSIEIIPQGNVSSYSGYKRTSSGCNSSQWQGCYPNVEAAYRFTLVDKNGKKIEGTKSVDYTGSVDTLNKWNSHTYKPINDKVQYKYGENDEPVSFIYLEPGKENDIYSFGGPTPNNIKEFIEKVSNYVLPSFDETPQWRKCYSDDPDECYPVNFLDMFLYDSGYITDKNRISIVQYPQNDSKYSVFADKDNPVYLIVEPTYFVWYNEVANVWNFTHNYGTISEYATKIYNSAENGLSWGLSRHMAFNHACHLSTPKVEGGLEVIKEDVSNNCQYSKTNSLIDKNGRVISLNWYQQNVEKLANTDWGYGVFSINVTSIITNKEGECSNGFCVNYCETGDGVVSFKPSAGSISYKDLMYSKELSDNPNIDDPEQRVSCYDNVIYDFKDSLNDLNGTRRTLTYLDFKPGKVDITRTCWVGSKASAPTLAKVIDDYASYNLDTGVYEAKNVNVKAFAKNDGDSSGIYVLTAELINILNDGLKGQTVSYDGKIGSIYTYSFSLSLGLNENDKILLKSKPERLTSGMYINFSATPFGASNNIIEKMSDNVGYSDVTYSSDGKVENAKCYFDMNFISGSIKFRTISLENPFPARDGTSRLPGTNWLYEDNYVFDYITNNRGVRYAYASNHGLFDLETNSCTDCDKVTFITDRTASSQDKINVSPEAIYTELEPMYSVTLTPSTMLKIRGYNKAHQYTSMYLDSTVDYMADKLSCVDGRECYSPFLRDDSYIPNDSISGTCFFSKEEDMRQRRSNPYAYGYITKGLNSIEKENYDYIGGYDFNKNLIFDSTDAQIAKSVSSGDHSKLTDFYYCANKTYLSGGPEDYGCVVRGDGE